MPRALVAVLTLAALVPVRGAAQQQPIEIKGGFITGNTYRAYSDDIRAVYVMGVLDGFDVAPAFSAPKKELAWFQICSLGMSGYQVAAIVDKYLRDIPEHWHEPMNGLVYAAMLDACQSYRR